MLAPAISNKFCNFVKLCLALLRRFVTKIRFGSYSNRRETRDHLDSLSLAFSSLDNEQLQAIVEQNSQQSAKEMFEVPFKYPVNEAVAVLTARVSVSVTDSLLHFVEDFIQQFV